MKVCSYLGGLSLDVVVEVAVHELDRHQGAASEDHVVAVGNVVAQALCEATHAGQCLAHTSSSHASL